MEQKNLKPFDLEKALAGEPVITRIGLPVEIGAYNDEANVEHKIVGWVEGEAEYWAANGRYWSGGSEDDRDLFMGPIEKEGWVWVCKPDSEGKTYTYHCIFDMEGKGKEEKPLFGICLTKITWTE